MKKWVIDNVITPILLARALAAYRHGSQRPSDFERLGNGRSTKSIKKAVPRSKPEEKPEIG